MTTNTMHRVAPTHTNNLLTRVAAAYAVYRQRRQLADLDAHLRADLGLTEADVLRETNRSVWDVPTSWRA